MSFDLTNVRERLPGRRIDWFSSVSSTMTLAAQASRDGAPCGTVIGADGQVAGIGRHGHSWHSEAEAGLYVSVVLRLPLELNSIPVLMLALGLATQRAIANVTGLNADLRWPNDVLIEENGVAKKCAGILAQLEGKTVIAGIGINVNHIVFPTDIEATATSLRLAGKQDISREDLLVALLGEIDTIGGILTAGAPARIFELFSRSSSYVDGRRVRVDRPEGVVEGVTCGLNESGYLLVKQDDGEIATILAGGVRPA